MSTEKLNEMKLAAQKEYEYLSGQEVTEDTALICYNILKEQIDLAVMMCDLDYDEIEELKQYHTRLYASMILEEATRIENLMQNSDSEKVAEQ